MQLGNKRRLCIVRAEVSWTLKMNVSQYSYKSAEDSGSLFRAM